MARKRKAKTSVTETDNTTATATIEPPATMPAEPQPTEPAPVEQAPTFVDRLAERGTRPRVPDPFLIALDNAAGVRLFENRRARVMAIAFDERPIQPVIDAVKAAGYRWNPDDRVWTRPVHAEAAMSTRIDAERLYQDACRMIRQEKGIDAGQDLPR